MENTIFINRNRRFFSSLWKKLLLFLTVFGPATITAMADNDAGGVATYSIAGAKLGYPILFLLPTLASPAVQLLMAPLVGLGLGVAYYSSIYYSLNAADRPGRNTGIHEAIIGSGVLVAPPLGGALATLTGRLTAPYLLVAGLSLAAIGVEEAVSRRFRRG